MKVIAWLLAPLLTALLAVPVAVALVVTTVVAPVTGAAATPPGPCAPETSVGGSVIGALPPAGEQRRASVLIEPTDIPAHALVLYQQAADAYRLPWPLLAGVGMAESDHGRRAATSSAGAQGLMQFLPATFAAYGVDADRDGTPSITSDSDSIFSAANYLAASGATEPDAGVRRALYAYNHATWYVNDVLHYAHHYASYACASEASPLPDRPHGPCPPSGSPAERGLQPAALQALRCVKQTFPWITSIGGVGNRPNTSDHPAGRAVDYMIPNWNTPEGNARGWQLARWLQDNAASLNVKYVIYDDKVWRAYRPHRGWTNYTHPNGTTTSPTLRHLDHVHISTT